MSGGGWHTVKQGEWLTKIAHQYGIVNWREKIWELPENANLAEIRDPHLLFPGDRIVIPTAETKAEDRPTDQKHEFVRKKVWDDFYLLLLDAGRQPIANEDFVLYAGAQEYSGTTNPRGEVIVKNVDPEAGNGSLVLPGKGLVLPIQMGHMNAGHATGRSERPHYDNGISGIQMRLLNLGYDCGPADGIMGPRTRAALTEFQVFEMERQPDEATGELDDDTRDAIVDAHGS